MKRLLAVILTLLLVPVALGAALVLTILAGETTLGGVVLLGLLLISALGVLTNVYGWVCQRLGLETIWRRG